MASTSAAIFALLVWLWVLWDDRNGCSGPVVRVGTSRLGRRVFLSLQTTFSMNVCDSVGKWQAWRGLDAAFCYALASRARADARAEQGRERTITLMNIYEAVTVTVASTGLDKYLAGSRGVVRGVTRWRGHTAANRAAHDAAWLRSFLRSVHNISAFKNGSSVQFES